MARTGKIARLPQVIRRNIAQILAETCQAGQAIAEDLQAGRLKAQAPDGNAATDFATTESALYATGEVLYKYANT